MSDTEHCREVATKYVDSIASKATAGLGTNPVVYLDSGAIIHFENTIRSLRKASANRFGSSDFYNLMKNAVPKLFVTSYVLSEIDKHHRCHSLNGHPELCCETRDAAREMHKSLCTFIRESEHQKSYDDIRYDVFWASLLPFPQNHKKCNGDRISITDKDLITACVDSRYTEGTTGVSVLTTDAHVAKTIEVLTASHSTAMDNYHAIMAPISGRIIGDLADSLPLFENSLFEYNGVKAINLMEGKK